MTQPTYNGSVVEEFLTDAVQTEPLDGITRLEQGLCGFYFDVFGVSDGTRGMSCACRIDRQSHEFRSRLHILGHCHTNICCDPRRSESLKIDVQKKRSIGTSASYEVLVLLAKELGSNVGLEGR